MPGNSEEKIVAKLELLIRLQALSLVKEFGTAKEKIIFLSEVGLQPKEIADLLKTTPNHVSVTLSAARRDKS
jgi:hypothetical protein